MLDVHFRNDQRTFLFHSMRRLLAASPRREEGKEQRTTDEKALWIWLCNYTSTYSLWGSRWNYRIAQMRKDQFFEDLSETLYLPSKCLARTILSMILQSSCNCIWSEEVLCQQKASFRWATVILCQEFSVASMATIFTVVLKINLVSCTWVTHEPNIESL